MAQDIIQAFLTARLFTVGGEDSRLDKLRAAAGDVATLLKATPARSAAFTMVAMDQHIAADEPILAEVAAKIEKHWNSYTGSFAETVLPVVLRAVILDALARTVSNDPIAVAVALTARNLSPHLGSANDKPFWVDILGTAEHRLELRARREWAMPSTVPASELTLEIGTPKPLVTPGIPQDWLIKRLSAAAGPTDAQSATLESANPHWTNSAPQWSYEFAPRAAKAIAAAVDSVTKVLGEAINQQSQQTSLPQAISSYIRDVTAAMIQSSAGLERRTSLIWWKEALYSPGAASSYRDMAPGLAASWMAIDAAEQTGPFAPRMAEAVVRETMRSLVPASSEEMMALADLAAPVFEEGERSLAARGRLSLSTLEAGRTPLASLIGQGVSLDATTIRTRLGLMPDFRLTLGDFALWLYRDYQAAIATQIAPKGRRKAKT